MLVGTFKLYCEIQNYINVDEILSDRTFQYIHIYIDTVTPADKKHISLVFILFSNFLSVLFSSVSLTRHSNEYKVFFALARESLFLYTRVV